MQCAQMYSRAARRREEGLRLPRVINSYKFADADDEYFYIVSLSTMFWESGGGAGWGERG